MMHFAEAASPVPPLEWIIIAAAVVVVAFVVTIGIGAVFAVRDAIRAARRKNML